MRVWLNTLLRVAAGMYFVVTSLYCLLAFLPYTYAAFIKTPPYAWMPWLAHHQARENAGRSARCAVSDPTFESNARCLLTALEGP